MVKFGQIVIGSPGAGKTTYCLGMQMFTSELKRNCAIINLDFANDILPYKPTIDVRELVTLQDAMENYELGPNGGLVFCMELLFKNIDWLKEKILALEEDYFIFDCPGQIELFTHHTVVQDLVHKLEKDLDFRLCSVNLLDSFYCTQPATFISATLLVTSTMLRLGLPHINVLSKVDMLKNYGQLPFHLNFFTELMNLAPLLRYLEGEILTPQQLKEQEQLENQRKKESDGEVKENSSNENAEELEELEELEEDNYPDYDYPDEGFSDDLNDHTKDQTRDYNYKYYQYAKKNFHSKFLKLTTAICEIVDDYGMVSFYPLYVEDPELMGRILAAVDRANGYKMAQDYLNYENPQHVRSTQIHFESPKELFDYASEQMDSMSILASDVQERYGSS